MKLSAFLPVALLAASCTAADREPVPMSPAAQAKLAQELSGRVAGRPQSCVSQRNLRGNRSAGEGAIIFEGPTRDLVYVNRPPAGCPDLSFSRALVTRTPSTQLCRGDIAQVVDLTSGISYGSCGLGDFTPYRRVR